MGLPLKSAARGKRAPLFGDNQEAVVASGLFGLGLVAVVTFYASVFEAARIVTVDSGGGKEELATVGAWICVLLIAQGLVPILRFSITEVPQLVVGNARGNARSVLIFVLLLVAGAMLLL